jgi:hypothetical protein
MANNKLGSALVVAVIGVASYWYFSPYLSVHQMRAAARAGDAAAFNDHVDYPKLRENIKGQFSSMLGASAPAAAAQGGTQGAGAAFGKMIGMALVDRMIDGMLRPEFVMQAMKQGKVSPRTEAPSEKGEPEWISEREGLNKFVVRLRDKESPATAMETGFVFERSGFAHWTLTEIKFPSIAKK